MDYTGNIGLRKPTDAESGNVADLNYNADIIDEEITKRGTTVNGRSADEGGNYQVDEVAFAQNLTADDAQQMSGEFLFRTTGGDASLTDGDATLVSILGRRTHTGVVEENLTLTVDAATREVGEELIAATIDRDTFVAYVSNSGTTTLTYTDAWSANPTLYGVTVTGTPVSGDQIQIVYVKEDRGTITVATPSAFRSTGWNLYNNSLGYARVKKYSDSYGFLIGGTYTAVKFATTVSGTQSTITPINGYFTVPSDGYVFVTGGNATDTYILMTWSDWTAGYEGSFKAYSEDTISLSTIMSNYFPYGLCQVGGIADEINLSAGYAISRITRLAYTAENLATAKNSGRAYEADTNYIYLEKETPEATAITVSGSYDAYDHGLEIIDGSSVAPFVQTLYGQNLKDKLRTDVLTKSAQALSDSQKSQVRTNICAASMADLSSLSGHIVLLDNTTRHTRKMDFSLSDLQAAVVDQNLELHGLQVGDQKTINGHTYVIAGLNVMKGSNSYTCTNNHVGLIVIPHTTQAWNASGSTVKTSDGSDNRGGGYKNCDLQYYLANTVMGFCNTDLGSSHLYQHKKLFGNTVNATGYNRFGTNTGCTSGWEWVDAYISALTEAQVFGGDHWSSSGYDTGEANTLLPVFAKYKHTDIFGNEYPWLRNVSSASQACYANDHAGGGAGGEIGVSNACYVAGLILYH